MGKKKKEVRDRACAERLLLRKKNGRETGLMIYLKSLQRSYLLAGGQWSQRAYTYTARIHHEDSRIQLEPHLVGEINFTATFHQVQRRPEEPPGVLGRCRGHLSQCMLGERQYLIDVRFHFLPGLKTPELPFSFLMSSLRRARSPLCPCRTL
ncbi:CDC42 small effector protein 1 isoform X1 [Hyla sarda]|uniref:CDC42 small effector protein 1 isoform X1 n=1 Tax=Hyla sarda TaxID=327740 RepID=UPI0024C2FC71|nr:CDC42 small effector protein 1 isoform X1 [Hyla sarda]